MNKPSVVFFGSGPVAAKSLQLLLSDFDIKAVVTKPQPLHHRGSFPVIDVAEANRLQLYTVRTKQELSDLIAMDPFRTEAAILVDFGIIVSQDVIDYFPKGIINSHFSLLPEWRGADPITFSILSGQKQTGVSLMLLVETMDEGPLLGFGIQPLSGTETTPGLTAKLIQLSDALLKEMVPSYLDDSVLAKTGEKITPRTQEEVSEIRGLPFQPTYSRKLTKEDGELDFQVPAVVLEREIRAFIDWPKSHTKLANIDVIITAASTTDDRGKTGTVVVKDKQLLIFCSDGALRIERLKPAGKSEMNAAAFLAGYGQKL